jgi:hypothetical protein
MLCFRCNILNYFIYKFKEMIKMNLKKLGIVLFLCMCVAGFCVSSVSSFDQQDDHVIVKSK